MFFSPPPQSAFLPEGGQGRFPEEVAPGLSLASFLGRPCPPPAPAPCFPVMLTLVGSRCLFVCFLLGSCTEPGTP